MSYLYSKLTETGVPRLIGTGGELDFGQFWQRAGERSLQGKQTRP